MIVLPNTGIQICQNHPIDKLDIDDKKIWELALCESSKCQDDDIIKLLSSHISCRDFSEEKSCEQTGWIRCAKSNFSITTTNDDFQDEFVYFRLVKISNKIVLDIVVDTRNGAGTQPTNEIGCVIRAFPKVRIPFFKKEVTASKIHVETHENASGKSGSLILDFGNSAITAIFSGSFTGNSDVIKQVEPFDPNYRERTEIERVMKKSTLAFLRVPPNPKFEPWLVTGKRADELVRIKPSVTYVYSPKKYIRNWPSHLKARAPTSHYEGLIGKRGVDEKGKKLLFPYLDFVKIGIEHTLSCLMSSIVNPHLGHSSKIEYPIIDRIILTYPLVWRLKDKIVFQKIVQDAVNKTICQGNNVNEKVDVELICSEPVAVAAYLVWENLFHYGAKTHQLVSSTLGNTNGDKKLRLLILDIGGGTTDIAVVEIEFKPQKNREIDVYFKMIENIRFNRAGDRITHIILVSILEFIREKYDITESLHYLRESEKPTFMKHHKVNAVLELNDLAEKAKIHLAENDTEWVMGKDLEKKLLKHFHPILEKSEEKRSDSVYTLTRKKLEAWIRKDKQRLETHGEPGFMDIFLFLKELQRNLNRKQRTPHLCVLSGRTTRLSFIKKLAVESTGMPYHKVRSLIELLPVTQEYSDQQDMDKLAVVIGSHRFRFGENVHFIPLLEEIIFNRYIWTIMETPKGLVLNNVIIKPGEIPPCSKTLTVHPTSELRVGHAFREDGVAQVIAKLSNDSEESQEVTIDIEDDFTISLNKGKNITLSEWVPGGDDIIVDSFNDTGDIDPKKFILRHVIGKKERL